MRDADRITIGKALAFLMRREVGHMNPDPEVEKLIKKCEKLGEPRYYKPRPTR
jgi:hypothetical protein